MYMNSQFVMAVSIVWIQIKINSLIAIVILMVSNISWVYFYARHHAKFLTRIILFTLHNMPEEIAIIPILRMKQRQRAIKECTQWHSAVEAIIQTQMCLTLESSIFFHSGSQREVYVVNAS